MNPIDTVPAWKHPWFLFVFGLPAIVVVACFVTLYLAIKSDDGVVADDYYKQGLAINQDLRRDDKAREHGLTAQLDFVGDSVELHLVSNPAASAALAGQPIKLVLQNMGVPAQDQVLTLVPTAQTGVWRSQLTRAPSKGLWQIRLEQADWRLIANVKGMLNQSVAFK